MTEIEWPHKVHDDTFIGPPTDWWRGCLCTEQFAVEFAAPPVSKPHWEKWWWDFHMGWHKDGYGKTMHWLLLVTTPWFDFNFAIFLPQAWNPSQRSRWAR